MQQTDHDIDALAQALYNLSALRRDLQRFAGIEHAVGGLMVLAVVHRIGPVRISDVASDMQVNLSVASRQIQALEDDGYVDRVPDPNDGRSSLIAISAAGLTKLERAHQRLVGAIATAVDDWERSEITGLADGIVRLRAALGTCVDHHLPADRPAADPTLTSAAAADARHEEHLR
ncbi:MarR family winged helix-turn-helix transcriptional regulator [Patulibacter sp.]|uniref:MarR family winged helix-turn-helix transcriptional regulator n=1 Tax=Patulibacter sp. TaxID=1912859 RepID=UPI00271C1136|nr:MarR family transcriptional regulator [Patulibacter sp.]MDO9410291.1 MarR family transcriptional regulator [Patulibacter sp.]